MRNLRSLASAISEFFNPKPVFVHIGKCGGSSCRKRLDEIKFRYVNIHIRQIPSYSIPNRRRKFYIVIRNPIARAVSAFNWRRKLVYVDQTQRNRFPGEYEVLAKYQSVNDLAENLCDENGLLRDKAVAEFNRIHHLRERISLYIAHFDIVKDKRSITGVLMQGSLADDIARVFKVPLGNKKEKANFRPDDEPLSDQARRNLTRLLKDDFTVIEQLWQIGVINGQRYQNAMAERLI